MLVHSHPAALSRRPRAVAVGTFDGVHTGHRALLRRTGTGGLVPTVVTFDPHPRLVLGRPVDLIAPLPRRLQLMADAGITDVLGVRFTEQVARQAPQEWAEQVLRPMGTPRVVVGEGFRFGARAAGDAGTLRDLGFAVEEVCLQGGASSTRIRQLVAAGEISGAARMLGRAVELEGALSSAHGLPAVFPARVRMQLLGGAGVLPAPAMGRPHLRPGRPLVPAAGVAMGAAS